MSTRTIVCWASVLVAIGLISVLLWYDPADKDGLVGVRGGEASNVRTSSSGSSGEQTQTAGPADDQPTSQERRRLAPELQQIFGLIRADRTGPARIRLNKYLKLNPDDGRAQFLFALSYHHEKRYEKAREFFELAIDNAPEYDLTHYFFGWSLYWLGELDAAEQQFQAFLESDPDERDAHFAMGLIALDEDRLDEAERRFRRAIALAEELPAEQTLKDRSKARTNLAEVYMRQGDYAKAREELVIATELYPDHYQTLYKLYRALLRLGEEDQAQQVFEQYERTRNRLHPGTSFPE